MKRTNLLALLLLFTTVLNAQAPQRMSFQAVVRDGDGALVTNGTVGMRISVLQGGENGTAVYVETHEPQTNANGLITLEVGGGTVVSGTMDAINWAEGPYHLKTETDPEGGTDYSVVGSSQLLSVPYALHAANSGIGPQGPVGPQGPQGPPGTSDCPIIHTADGRAVVYTATTAHGVGLSSVGGTQWYATTLDGPVLGSITSDSSVVLYTATTAYGFGLSSTGGSMWYLSALDAAPVGAVAASGRIVVFTGSTAHGFGRSSTGGTNWYISTLSGPVNNHVVAGNRIVLTTGTSAYAFGLSSVGGSQWYVSALPSAPLGGIGTR